MSRTEGHEGLQEEKAEWEEDSRRLKEKRRSLEEKAVTLEERARLEKLAIDKKLVMEILEEENRTHNDAVKELEDKIASLERQMKSSSSSESVPTQTVPEPPQEISEEAEEDVGVGALQGPGQNEVEVLQEGSKKRKRHIL
jgi:chromosome segregation ATPase